MFVLYQDLTDEELVAKIANLTSLYETAISGGTAVVVAGEGRRVEYTRSNAAGLASLITAAQREQQRRAGVQITGAIAVSYPYGGC
jgi:membrane protease subunit (stomatin/prohibitin family)